MVIGDEINRASPRTQSALLEAMAERQVTVDGRPEKLRSPFFCVATQNPIEHQGTYPLPEAQLDRFMMKLVMGYPAAEVEREIIQAGVWRQEPEPLVAPRLSGAEVAAMIAAVPRVAVSDTAADYVQRMVAATRDDPRVLLGASPRATVALASAAQAHALSRGFTFVCDDDVAAVAVDVLAHRLILGSALDGEAVTQRARQVVTDVVAALPRPLVRCA